MHKLAVPFLIALGACILGGCSGEAGMTVRSACDMTGPQRLAPPALQRVRLGMSRSELAAIFGAPDYSPAPGIYYFGTEGACPLGDTGRTAGCGVVAEFRRFADSTLQVTDTLQACSWGAIGE